MQIGSLLLAPFTKTLRFRRKSKGRLALSMSKIQLEFSLDTCFLVSSAPKENPKFTCIKYCSQWRTTHSLQMCLCIRNGFNHFCSWNLVNYLGPLEVMGLLPPARSCPVPLSLQPGSKEDYLRVLTVRVPVEDISRLRSDNKLWKNTLIHILYSENL